jgi:hypothetical protein
MTVRPQRLAHRFAIAVGAIVFSAGLVPAQTCDTLLGAANCGSKSLPQNNAPRDRGSSVQPDWRFGNDPGGLGTDLGRGGDEPAVFGAITFSGRGTTCSGPFRSRAC